MKRQENPSIMFNYLQEEKISNQMRVNIGRAFLVIGISLALASLVQSAESSSTVSTLPSFTLSPSFRNIQGSQIMSAHVGEQLMVTTTFNHLNTNRDQQFVTIVEVRDTDGITAFVAWQSGIIEPGANYALAASWVVNEPGEYFIRSFVVSTLSPSSSDALSHVHESALLLVE